LGLHQVNVPTKQVSQRNLGRVAKRKGQKICRRGGGIGWGHQGPAIGGRDITGSGRANPPPPPEGEEGLGNVKFLGNL